MAKENLTIGKKEAGGGTCFLRYDSGAGSCGAGHQSLPAGNRGAGEAGQYICRHSAGLQGSR